MILRSKIQEYKMNEAVPWMQVATTQYKYSQVWLLVDKEIADFVSAQLWTKVGR